MDVETYDAQHAFVNDTRPEVHDPANAKLIGNWSDDLKFDRSGRCHHQNEVSPGIIIAACQPIYLLSVRAEDGGLRSFKDEVTQLVEGEARRVIDAPWPDGASTGKGVLAGEPPVNAASEL